MTAIVRVAPILGEFERMFGEVWAPWKPALATTGLGIDMDVHETKDELVVKADLPGVAKEDLHITLEEETLKIEAEKKEEKAENGTTWYLRERSFGKYSRTIGLPFRVAVEKISATLEKGALEIRLPKGRGGQSQAHRSQSAVDVDVSRRGGRAKLGLPCFAVML